MLQTTHNPAELYLLLFLALLIWLLKCLYRHGLCVIAVPSGIVM